MNEIKAFLAFFKSVRKMIDTLRRGEDYISDFESWTSASDNVKKAVREAKDETVIIRMIKKALKDLVDKDFKRACYQNQFNDGMVNVLAEAAGNIKATVRALGRASSDEERKRILRGSRQSN